MPNLQYIGARYVPVVFSNPDDDSSNWKSGISYENLVIVTYLDDSYTSRKPVPSSVGNPADNPDYWAKTGDFNAALTALQSRVYDLETQNGNNPLDTTAQTLSGAVNELNGKIGNDQLLTDRTTLTGGINEIYLRTMNPHRLRNRKVLFVGDSYGVVTDNWVGKFITITGLKAENCVNLCYGGAGFIDPQSFLNQIRNYVPSEGMERDKITDIIVCGGVNDADPANSPTINTINAAIQTFVNYAKQEYPFATVYIGMIGRLSGLGLHSDYIYNLNFPVLDSYKYHSPRYGAVYLNGVENAMWDYKNFFNSDGVHPNNDGSLSIAMAVANAWRSGSYQVISHPAEDYELDANLTNNGSFHFRGRQQGDIISIDWGGILDVDTPFSMTGLVTNVNLMDWGLDNYKGGWYQATEAQHNSQNMHAFQCQFYTMVGGVRTAEDHTRACSIHFYNDGHVTLELLEAGQTITDISRIVIPFDVFTVDLYGHR